MVCHWTGIYFHGQEVGLKIFQEVVKRLNKKYDHLLWMKLSEIAAALEAELVGDGAAEALRVVHPADAKAATDLALVLRTGSLPISLEPSTFEQVSPTLGAASLDAGLLAGGIGLLLVGAWLLFFYRWLGLVALSALVVFSTVVVGFIAVLGELGFALTLAGVAGIIVAVGITADSSILFIERIRDELALGKTVRSAALKAYASAFRTNLAGNTVTFAAAIVLYALAVGPVRGFALMLGLATVLDIVILAGFTRPVVFLMVSSGFLDRGRLGLADRSVARTQEVPA